MQPFCFSLSFFLFIKETNSSFLLINSIQQYLLLSKGISLQACVAFITTSCGIIYIPSTIEKNPV